MTAHVQDTDTPARLITGCSSRMSDPGVTGTVSFGDDF